MGYSQLQTLDRRQFGRVLIERLSSLLKEEPPGYKAQSLLSLGDRVPPDADEFDRLNARKAGVMVLLFLESGSWHTVLIKRPSYPGTHSDQMAFPGGKHEEGDVDLLQTALRETHEEIELPPDRIEHVGPLSPLYIPPSNFMVHPYVGMLEGERRWIPEVAEVAEIIEMPLEIIVGTQHVKSHPVRTRYGKMMVPAYEFNGHIIWGATGMMLAEPGAAVGQAGFGNANI